jgi:hypothetical protein
MKKRKLFKLTSSQKISRCLIGGRPCGFYLHYGGFNFCLSEILGQGCEFEKSEKLEDSVEDPRETNYRLPLTKEPDTVPLRQKRRNFEFRVYYRDCVTRSIILLGKVIERRSKDRGNNLRDLLVKAVRDYSNCVADPSSIFLLNS